MSSRVKGLGTIVLAAALALTLIGCTDATDLESGNYVVKLVPVATNDAGVPFDCVLLDFGGMRIAPLDDETLDSLGSTPQIALIRESLQRVSFLDTPCSAGGVNDLPEIVLPAGDYVFTALDFSQFSFEDGSSFPPSCFAPANYLDSGPAPVFSGGPDRANVVEFELDIGAIVDDLNTSSCINFFFEPRTFLSVDAS